MGIHSHVQIPKGILKAFSHRTKDGNCVYYLDLHDMQIYTQKIKVLDAVFDFYSEPTERLLDAVYENPFLQLAVAVREFSTAKRPILELTEDQQKDIRSFIKMSVMRSNYTFDLIEKTSLVGAVIPDSLHDLAIWAAHNTLSNFEFFEDYKLNILVNYSDVRLVVPKNCIGYSSSNGEPFIVLPLSPKVAILYQSPKFYQECIDEDKALKHVVYKKGDEAEIRALNVHIAKSERFFNDEFVVGYKKEELEILKSDLSGEPK